MNTMVSRQVVGGAQDVKTVTQGGRALLGGHRAAAPANFQHRMKSSGPKTQHRQVTTCVTGGANSSKYGARVIGTGSAAPSAVLTNHDLEKLVDTNDEWIFSRTGISRRHILGDDESLTEFAAEAAAKALEMGGVDASEVDLILLCTSTPDDLFGSACQVQGRLGASNAVSYDLTAACSGFVVGLVTAVHMMRGGAFKNVLVIGADALSRYVDWRDRGTCILFGDGCGAVLLKGVDDGACSMLGFDMNSDGSMNKALVAPFDAELDDCDPSKPLSSACADGKGSFENITMKGSDIFKFAVRAVPEVVGKALKAGGLEVEDIDHLVLHQANQRIIESAAKRLKLSDDKIVSNISEYGNTSAASIPLAFDEAVREGKVKEGDVVAFAGFGAGLTWASAIMRFG
ncbi:hypothetical protein CYMTET_10035 [Cymbomonas tetramitiformis]|uniref:beta-ketoacyl-[acyl-carrier-protein] synthase III n=1 Tax=Cymbomonas tetramitiformis TaxID=36881 RepID=A0AAE0GQK3_9CHLO|nr:hypothetical protein CYMTET_10035 [Cymbomonas tetramitiformis]